MRKKCEKCGTLYLMSFSQKAGRTVMGEAKYGGAEAHRFDGGGSWLCGKCLARFLETLGFCLLDAPASAAECVVCYRAVDEQPLWTREGHVIHSACIGKTN
jgi:hypothetical protein